MVIYHRLYLVIIDNEPVHLHVVNIYEPKIGDIYGAKNI